MKTGLWVIDVQEKLFPKVLSQAKMLNAICLLLETAPFFNVPILLTEQNPSALGPTLPEILEKITSTTPVVSKTAFSGYLQAQHVIDPLVDQWILVGLEAHICVLQTARDLIQAGKSVIICQDAISARESLAVSSAIHQLDTLGACMTVAETIVYDWIKDASSPLFKHLLPIIKRYA